MSTPYYQASGRVAPAAYLLAAVFALAIPPGAWVYAWLTIHVPAILNVFIVFGYAVYLGWLVRRVAAGGRVRNARWISRAGLLFALLGWYCQWAAWVALMGKHAPGLPALGLFIQLCADPWTLARGAAAFLGEGTRHIGGWNIAGVVLFLIWLLELGVHLLLPGPMGSVRASEPFCEAADRWADKLPVPGQFAPVDAALVVGQLEADPGQVRQLLVPLSGDDADHFARVALYRCQGADSYLSIVDIVRPAGSRDTAMEKETPVLEYLRLPGIDPDALLRHWEDARAGGADQAAGGRAAVSAEAPVAPELDTALAHLQAERFEEALAGAAPGIGSDQPTLRTDANRICALACSRLGRWEEARGYWQALDADEPTAHNALQLATTSVMAGELADGIRLVEEARDRNERSGEMAPLAILTNFVTALTQTGHVREAMPYVDAIRQAYLSVGTTDPTLLYASGMPAFGVFLEKSRPVVCAALDGQKAQRWYASMLPRLDEAGQAELNVWLEGGLAFPPAEGMPG